MPPLSPAPAPPVSAIAEGASSTAVGSIGRIDASNGSSVHIGNIHTVPPKDPPRVIFKAWEMNPVLPDEIVRAGQTGCYLATEGSAAYKVKIEPFPIGSVAYAEGAGIEWIAPHGREFALVWLMNYGQFAPAKFLIKETMAQGNPRGGDILAPDYTTKIRAVYTDADGSCWYETVADLQYISSQGRLTFTGHSFRTCGPSRPATPVVPVVRLPESIVRQAVVEPITIDWNPGEFQFRHHFTLNGENLLFRVRVTNNSAQFISHAEVKLTDMQPPMLPCVPVRLMLMNEPQSPGIFSLPANGGSQFIDVIQQNTADMSILMLWHLAPGIERRIPAREYTFRITAYTESTNVSRTFRLLREGSGFTMFPAGDLS